MSASSNPTPPLPAPVSAVAISAPRRAYVTAVAWWASVQWKWRLLLVFVGGAGLAGLFLTGLGKLAGTEVGWNNLWFWMAAALPGLIALLYFTPVRALWIRRVDRRIGAMLLATELAVWGTLIGLMLGWHVAVDQNPSAGRDLFINWTASVIFWALVGLVVAVVSIIRPEEGDYYARARILFRAQMGPHIDHMIETMRGTVLGHYAETIERDIIIQRYHTGELKFRLQLESRTILHAYLDDTLTSYKSSTTIQNSVQPPAGEPVSRIIRARCMHSDGAANPTAITEIKDDQGLLIGFKIDFESKISEQGSCEVSYARTYWVESGRENAFELERFTRASRLRLRLDAPELDKVTVRMLTPLPARDVVLHRADGWIDIPLPSEGKPDSLVYDFHLIA